MPTFSVAQPRVRYGWVVGACLVALSVLSAAPALAQQRPGHDSHWGATFSITPSWTIHDSIKKVLFDGEGTIEGSEITVGLARGSRLGGDIGINFVRKPWKDGSGTIESDQQCFGQTQGAPPCFPTFKTTSTQGVYLNGIEFDWFWAIATIKERAQIGLGVGGGVASVKGNVVITRDDIEVTGFNPLRITQVHSVETNLAKDELLPIFPLFKLEAQGAVILAPGLKLKIAGGLNFPAVSMRIGVVYLIGAK